MGEILSSKDVIIPSLNKTLYEIILDQSSDPIFCFDEIGTYLYINLAFSNAFKLMPSDIVGKRIWDVFPGAEGDMRFAAVKKAYETKTETIIEVKVNAVDHVRYYLTTVTPILDQDGSPKAAICISKEITQRKEAELALQREKEMSEVKNRELDKIVKELYKKSITDDLTNLFSRQYSIEKIEESIINYEKFKTPIAVGIMDLDHFKEVNDTLGHLVGDQALIEIASDLDRVFGPYGIVGRYGGEEFILVLPLLPWEQAKDISNQFIELMNQKTYTSVGLKLSISIGLCLYHGEVLKDFLKKADDLLYLAKDNGRNRLEVSE